MEVDFSNSSKEEIEFFYKKISTNIKKYRLEKGLSQEKLALDIGAYAGTIRTASRFTSGHSAGVDSDS